MTDPIAAYTDLCAAQRRPPASLADAVPRPPMPQHVHTHAINPKHALEDAVRATARELDRADVTLQAAQRVREAKRVAHEAARAELAKAMEG